MYPIGKVYPGTTQTITLQESRAYADATGDSADDYTGPDAICPPMLHVRLLLPVMEAVANDPELNLDLLRLVHGEHDATFHRPLRPGDQIETRAVLESVTQKRSGLVVISRLFVMCDGQAAVEATTTFFIRAPREPDAPPATPRPAPPAPPPPDATVDWQVAEDQSHRYAKVSLDNNPIHTDPDIAAAAGLPDVILHGLCTMAMAGRTVTTAAHATPRRVRRLGVRFAGMVFNGMHLQTRIWHADGKHHFAVLGPDQRPVITNGTAQFSE